MDKIGHQMRNLKMFPILPFFQVMRLGFRCDESVYTSVRGRQERPRGPPMAHMDYTNIYAPRRVRVIRF